MQEKNLYETIVQIIDTNIIFCLFPCILTLLLISLLFKNRSKTKKALNIIRWFIIGYSIITVSYYIIGIIFEPEKHAFMQRATGPYWFAYWFMFICAIVLPFTLFIKKLASNYFYVLLVAVLMKSGFYFERFVLIVTTLHRDYFPSNTDSFDLEILWLIALLLLQGFILALILLGIVEVFERYKTHLNIPKKNT